MEKKRTIFLILILSLLIFKGCRGCEDTGFLLTEPNDHLEISIQENVYSNGLYLQNRTVKERSEIERILKSWVKTRIEEWLGEHPDKPDIPFRVEYVLIDDDKFSCSSSLTGLCSGQLGSGRLEVAIYSQWKGENFPTHNAPPHTIFSGDQLAEMTGKDMWRTGKWYAGIIHNIGVPAIGHELDHAIGRQH